MRNPLSETIVGIEPSGIRKFFDVVSEMKDAISLGVGEPDFDTPWHIRDEGIYSLEKGRTFYTSNAGLKELKVEISRYLYRKYDLEYDYNHEIIVTVGGSEAIDIAMRAMLDPGDEVLIPQPSYVSYLPCAVLANGKPVIIELKAENEFRLTREELEAAITPKTKLLVLPFPNNPTGAVMRREDLEAIAEVVEQHDLFVLSEDLFRADLRRGIPCLDRVSAGHEGADDHDQRLFQIPCNDRMAAWLRVWSETDLRSDVKDPSVCNHVRTDDEPVCGSRCLKKRG